MKLVFGTWASGVKKQTLIRWRRVYLGKSGPRELTQLQRLVMKWQDHKDVIGLISTRPDQYQDVQS